MITYNGTYIGELLKITAIGGRGPVGQTVIRKYVPGKDRTHIVRAQAKERPIPVSFILIGKNLKGLRQKVDELNSILITNSEVPIQFSDEPDKTYYGMLDGDPDWEEIMGNGKGTIYLICSDSKKLGQERNFPVANQFSILNNGTADAFPFFDITITAATNTLSFTCNNKTMKLTRNFSVGDRVQLDFKRRKVFLNGVESGSILDLSSRWFIFKPGSNPIVVSPTNKINGTAKFQERWL